MSVSRMLEKSYDFVIVGGGTAGCLLANRLSQNPEIQVALVESGPNDQIKNMDIPALNTYYKQKQKQFFYPKLVSNPLKFANNQKIKYPQAQILGGNSTLDDLTYLRGFKTEYEKLGQLLGEDWNLQNIIENYKRHEQNEYQEDKYHSQNGEQIITSQNYIHDISEIFLESCKHFGLKQIQDFNQFQENQMGVGKFQTKISKGQKFSSAQAFLNRSIRNRSNLDVITDLQANKINMLSENLCHSVQLIGKDGRHVRLEARKEIVLTAGAIFNPRILLLTGFGSEEQLKKINVRCLQNIPGVGQNLQDSPQLFLRNLLKLNGKTPLSPSFQNISKINKQFREFKQQGTGSFSSNLHEVGGFQSINQDQNQIPDFKFSFIPLLLSQPNQYLQMGQGVTVQLGLQNPLSQGSINLTSRNYDKNPEIELNYLQKDEDLQRLKEGVKQICQIMEQSPIKDFIKKSIDIKSNDSDNNIEKFIKNNIFSGGDPRGTCKMGKSNDSVVDDKFKVHNVNNLRIADCSILPQWISGNQSTMSAMIAEICFDRIKKEHDI